MENPPDTLCLGEEVFGNDLAVWGGERLQEQEQEQCVSLYTRGIMLVFTWKLMIRVWWREGLTFY